MELEPSDPQKTIMFVSAFNPDVRNAVIPTDDQIEGAAEMTGLGSQDGSAWEVYDALGDIMERAAADLVGESSTLDLPPSPRDP